MTTQAQALALVEDLENDLGGCTAQEQREVQALRHRVDDHDLITDLEYQDFKDLLESIR